MREFFSRVMTRGRGPAMKLWCTWYTMLILYMPMLWPVEGYITVPVADFLAQPVRVSDKQKVMATYQQLPFSTDKSIDCPRVHQGRFNERVLILKKYNHQVCIAFPGAFYGTSEGLLYNYYWTLEQNVASLAPLKKKGMDIFVPPSPTYSQLPASLQTASVFLLSRMPGTALFKNQIPDHTKVSISDQKVVTLIAPFFDRLHKITYSAGTRFVVANVKNSALYYTVHVYNAHKNRLVQLQIPKRYCLLNSARSTTKQRRLFVSLLKQWAHYYPPIPYVWGGSTLLGNTKKQIIKAGFDCAGIIWLAAYCVGIPLLLKNSTALSYYLNQLEPTSTLHIGDIIWFPGHVIVVSDLKRNLAVEARGYNHGYGKVQEIALGDLFKNITTYTDLLKAYANKTPLERLNSNKKVVQIIREFKILDLMSAWHLFVESDTERA